MSANILELHGEESPVRIVTMDAHGLTTGDYVSISGASNNEGLWGNSYPVTVIDSTTFTLDGTTTTGGEEDETSSWYPASAPVPDVWSFVITGPTLVTKNKDVTYRINLMRNGVNYDQIPIPDWADSSVANIPDAVWALFVSTDIGQPTGATRGSFTVKFPDAGTITLTATGTPPTGTCTGSLSVVVSEQASDIDAQVLGTPIINQPFQMAITLKNSEGTDFSSSASITITAEDAGACNSAALPATIYAQQGQALITLTLSVSGEVTVSSPAIEVPYSILVELGEPV